MDSVKQIIDMIIKVMQININMFGYDITLFELFVYGGILTILMGIFYGLME